VYATLPPAGGRAAGTGRLRITAIARRAFDGPPEITRQAGHEAHLRRYLSDMLRPYGITLRDSVAGHSYGEMAAVLTGELAAPGQPVDLLVLAFAIPDIRPGRATATYLSEVCPGRPFAFAICDQGGAAAFTGLRLVGEYLRAGTCRRALLLVVEQAALPYHTGVPVEVPTGHTAVGLRCEPAGQVAVGRVRQHAEVAPQRAGDLLADALAEARGGVAGAGEVTLVTDARLAARLSGPTVGQVRVAPSGRPHTGVWWELAAALHRPAGTPSATAGERLLLASYDRQLRYLCLATIDRTSAPPQQVSR
jgi:hypothetical protein